MITMSTLGNNGAMGNQLFQYAVLYGISKKTGFEMRIPPPPDDVQGDFHIIGHTNEGNPIEKYDYSLGYFDYLQPFFILLLSTISRVVCHQFPQKLF